MQLPFPDKQERGGIVYLVRLISEFWEKFLVAADGDRGSGRWTRPPFKLERYGKNGEDIY